MNKNKVGLTQFDKLCHAVHGSHDNGKDYLSNQTDIRCGHCGNNLHVYYCEDQLYHVRCPYCDIIAIVKAKNIPDAAFKTFAYQVKPISEISENCSVFWAETPIDEPPTYVGSTADSEFPANNLCCGMELPCPGTDGTTEKEKR